MKKTIAGRERNFCDICNREQNYLNKCLVCGNEYCIMCHGIISGCVHQVDDICTNCSEIKNVINIVRKYAAPLEEIINKRGNELRFIKQY